MVMRARKLLTQTKRLSRLTLTQAAYTLYAFTRGLRLGNIQTVCVMLGPYRNLTTLTASIAFLHPQCQVLNHAGSKIFGGPADFCSSYSPTRFRRFVRYAIYLSRGGHPGGPGGSIAMSHAFTRHEVMKETVQERYGSELVKQDIRCLLWKESMWATNVFRKHSTNFGDLCARNDRLRFLMPIRSPLDCALSNLRKPLVLRRLVPNGEMWSFESVLDAVLETIAWFLDHQQRNPDRFFSFFQDEVGPAMLSRLAAFLQISPDERWIRDALRCYQLRAPYEYSKAMLDHYQHSLQARLYRHPAALERLSRFATMGQ